MDRPFGTHCRSQVRVKKIIYCTNTDADELECTKENCPIVFSPHPEDISFLMLMDVVKANHPLGEALYKILDKHVWRTFRKVYNDDVRLQLCPYPSPLNMDTWRINHDQTQIIFTGCVLTDGAWWPCTIPIPIEHFTKVANSFYPS